MQINERPMPHNLDTERAVLAAVIREPELIDVGIAHKLDSECFYIHTHREIWQACRQMKAENQAIDIITLPNFLNMRGTLENIGGELFLAELYNAIATTANFNEWVSLLVKLAARRELIKACTNTITDSYGDEKPVKEVIADHSAKVAVISGMTHRKGRETREVLAATNQMFAEGISGKQLVRYCVPEIDRAIIHARKQMHVLSAQPGTGKTAFALSAIAQQIQNDIVSAIFCNESSSEEITGKIISILSGIPYIKLLTQMDRLTPTEFQRYKQAVDTIKQHENNLFVYGGGDYQHSVAGMSGAMRRIKDERGRIDAVYVDYLQTMEPPRHLARSDKTPQVEYNVEAINNAFTTFDCAGTVLSQISREGAKAGRPKMHHLKYASAIEAEAHIISFLYREKINDPNQEVLETEWYSEKTRLFAPFFRKIMFKKATAEYTGKAYGASDRPNEQAP